MADRNPWIFFGQVVVRNGSKRQGPGSFGPGPCEVPMRVIGRSHAASVSNVHAVRTEVCDGVDVRAVLGGRAGLEVEVRPGGVAGGPGEAYLLPRGDRLAHGDTDGRQVAVHRVGTVVHPEDDLVAVRAAPAGRDDRAGTDRVDRGPGRGVEVDAGGTAGRPEAAAGLVAGGDVRAGDRRDEGVEALALGRAGGAFLGLALLLGLLLGGRIGLLLRGGLVGGLLLGGGLRVDLVGDRVT